MTSALARGPLADHFNTPQNAALALIDYQPARLAGVHSMDCLLVKNAVSILKTSRPFKSRSCTQPSTAPLAAESQPSRTRPGAGRDVRPVHQRLPAQQ